MQGYLISVLGKAQMFFGRHFLMAAAGSKNGESVPYGFPDHAYP